MLPPYWDRKTNPTEYEFEINSQIGKILIFQNMYLKACFGLGFADGVRRGDYIADSENKYREEKINEIGLLLEFSAGFLKELGIGVKFKAWVRGNPYGGLMVEFLGRRDGN